MYKYGHCRKKMRDRCSMGEAKKGKDMTRAVSGNEAQCHGLYGTGGMPMHCAEDIRAVEKNTKDDQKVGDRPIGIARFCGFTALTPQVTTRKKGGVNASLAGR